MYTFIGLKNKTLMYAVGLICVTWPQDFVKVIHTKVLLPELLPNFHYWCEFLYSLHSLVYRYQQELLHRDLAFATVIQFETSIQLIHNTEHN